MIRTQFGLPINVGLNIETPTTRHNRKYTIYNLEFIKIFNYVDK